MNIAAVIKNKLIDAEKTHKIKIPFAIESGSRGWGFASPDSDFDCRFIYIHEKDWYVSVTEKKDFIEEAADEVFDINGWDLKKILQHMVKSNAVIFEWLSSQEIYIKDAAVAEELEVLAKECFNPLAVSYHYLSLANNKLNEILASEKAKLKKYFYVLRPLANLNYIDRYQEMPPMQYMKTLVKTDLDNTIYNEILKLMEIKTISDESCVIAQNEILLDYFRDETEKYAEQLQKKHFKNKKDYDAADMVFRKIIEMVW